MLVPGLGPASRSRRGWPTTATRRLSELCRELGITPVTLYTYVGPQGQLREQRQKVGPQRWVGTRLARIMREGVVLGETQGPPCGTNVVYINV